MSILGANFKIYNPFMKQPIGYKLLFFSNMILIVALYAASVFITIKEIGFPFVLLILPGLFLFFLGQMITIIQIDILAKPFTFCLPNHNKIPLQIIFLIGIGIAVIYSIALLQLPFDTESKRFMIITSPVTVLAFYFLPVCFTLYLQNDKPNLFVMLSFGLLVVLVWLSLTFMKHTNYVYTAQELIPFCFIPLLISFIALVTAAWKMLGDSDLKRKSHGKDSKMVVAFYTMPLNRDTWDVLISSIRLSKKPKPENDAFDTLLVKMKTKQYFSIGRSFWGYLYSLISYGFSYHNISPIKYLSTIIFLGSIVLIISGYQVYGVKRFLPDDVSLNMVQMIVLLTGCILFDAIFRTYHHNQLIPVSRIQQFCLNLILFLSKSLLVILWFSIVIIVSYGLQHIMPDIKLMGNYFTYHRVGTQLIILALVIIPISSICSSFVKSFGLFLLICMCIGGVGGALLAMIKLNVINFRITMIILAFIIYTLFITLLIWHWFRRDHS